MRNDSKIVKKIILTEMLHIFFLNSPSKSVLTTKARREWSLLEGIVDCSWLGEDFAKDHAKSAHDVGDEK